MGSDPGCGSDDETSPEAGGRLWYFQKSCVGLALALWAAALTQPLAEFTRDDWGVIRTLEVYPFGTWAAAPSLAVLLVDYSLLAIIAAGFVLVAYCSGDENVRAYGSAIGYLVFLSTSCGIGILVETFRVGTPLAGMWMIVVATVLLASAMATLTFEQSTC
ncbi:hypothetical protein ACFYV7_39030 [Nocardia suismassiliense]|uniref:Uncharacterized protein n=1 Tax=Nocardia suismassiliense TaxID=2077092 RepID=A0ABW6R5N6_9NOCA